MLGITRLRQLLRVAQTELEACGDDVMSSPVSCVARVAIYDHTDLFLLREAADRGREGPTREEGDSELELRHLGFAFLKAKFFHFPPVVVLGRRDNRWSITQPRKITFSRQNGERNISTDSSLSLRAACASRPTGGLAVMRHFAGGFLPLFGSSAVQGAPSQPQAAKKAPAERLQR